MRFLFRMITLSYQDHFSQRKSLSEFLAQKGKSWYIFRLPFFTGTRFLQDQADSAV